MGLVERVKLHSTTTLTVHLHHLRKRFGVRADIHSSFNRSCLIRAFLPGCWGAQVMLPISMKEIHNILQTYGGFRTLNSQHSPDQKAVPTQLWCRVITNIKLALTSLCHS
ncbi:hypothetical protein CHARACLAT_001587 [Characodon lateralis]|uniref:Uncharacterized protein n=1 Tax=Characodon lateralis TaxID=208331 RepID=A0ABU7D7F8_9TELE|nr:hypothetical protein [Characodon lateralis]